MPEIRANVTKHKTNKTRYKNGLEALVSPPSPVQLDSSQTDKAFKILGFDFEVSIDKILRKIVSMKPDSRFPTPQLNRICIEFSSAETQESHDSNLNFGGPGLPPARDRQPAASASPGWTKETQQWARK